jgi:hypothetical protein
MNRDEAGAPVEIDRASGTCDGKSFPGESQNGRGSKRDHKLCLHKSELLVQPPSIVLDLTRCRFLMDAPFPALLKFEVFDGIGNIDLLAVDAGVGHSLIKQLAGGADERLALSVLLVPWLLTYEGDRCPDRTLA